MTALKKPFREVCIAARTPMAFAIVTVGWLSHWEIVIQKPLQKFNNKHRSDIAYTRMVRSITVHGNARALVRKRLLISSQTLCAKAE